ncbi:MAG TPA: ABC transporter ATP-binding protein [Pyrinomonadaceae bacterium]|nr:ABC transporter ATP-binding protein [Pyrinomonadaceae bacterium]
MKPIIKARGVSKQYRIGGPTTNYPTLREALAGALQAPLRWARNGRSQAQETFWALKDVEFDIAPGEVVGIIGRNGAGKSTLLKILSRITEPTTGRIDLYGRVSSLLEVGTGFHPELSGRENIYLNGAILGMKRAEMKRKFDEIVAFAEISRFIDTPVKFYSSGMYVRLAFAVAAHLEPEILVVDEVLAVGDMGFQQKCLNKMQDVGAQGRTVLFVSHNMAAVSRLCQRVILLSDGSVVNDGPSHPVIEDYLGSRRGTGAERAWTNGVKAPGDEVVRLLRVRVVDENESTSSTVDIRRPVGVEMTYEVLEPGSVLVPNYHFYNDEGVCLFVVQDLSKEARETPRERGCYRSTIWIPGNFLAEGRQVITAAISTYYPMVVHAFERDAVSFRVADSLEGDSARGDFAGVMPGAVRPIFDWTTRRVDG